MAPDLSVVTRPLHRGDVFFISGLCACGLWEQSEQETAPKVTYIKDVAPSSAKCSTAVADEPVSVMSKSCAAADCPTVNRTQGSGHSESWTGSFSSRGALGGRGLDCNQNDGVWLSWAGGSFRLEIKRPSELTSVSFWTLMVVLVGIASWLTKVFWDLAVA
jgi:hypothetical protein